MKRRLGNFATWLLLLMAVALGACQSTSGSFCKIAPDLRYSQKAYDAMSDEEAAKHLSYLKAREKLCKS